MKKDAFTKIYKEYAGELFRFCMYRTNAREDAEDIVAHIFIKLYREENIEAPRAWLYKVARNTIYDKYVRQNKNSESLDISEEEVELVADASLLVEDSVSKEIELDLVKKAMQQISTESSDIITMRLWNDMSFSEIAKILDLSEGTARQKFHRSVAELKKIIEKENGGTKLNSIAIPAIILCVGQYASTLPSEVSVQFTKVLASNLSINSVSMGIPSSIFAKLFATTTAKITTSVVAGVVLTSGVAGGVYLYQNNNSENSVDTQNTEVVEEVVEEISSTIVSTSVLSLRLPDGWSVAESSVLFVGDGGRTQATIPTVEVVSPNQTKLQILHGENAMSTIATGVGERTRSETFTFLDNSVDITAGIREVNGNPTNVIFTYNNSTDTTVQSNDLKFGMNISTLNQEGFTTDELNTFFEIIRSININEVSEEDTNQTTTISSARLGYKFEAPTSWGTANINEVTWDRGTLKCENDIIRFSNNANVDMQIGRTFDNCFGGAGGEVISSENVTFANGESAILRFYSGGVVALEFTEQSKRIGVRINHRYTQPNTQGISAEEALQQTRTLISTIDLSAAPIATTTISSARLGYTFKAPISWGIPDINEVTVDRETYKCENDIITFSRNSNIEIQIGRTLDNCFGGAGAEVVSSENISLANGEAAQIKFYSSKTAHLEYNESFKRIGVRVIHRYSQPNIQGISPEEALQQTRNLIATIDLSGVPIATRTISSSRIGYTFQAPIGWGIPDTNEVTVDRGGYKCENDIITFSNNPGITIWAGKVIDSCFGANGGGELTTTESLQFKTGQTAILRFGEDQYGLNGSLEYTNSTTQKGFRIEYEYNENYLSNLTKEEANIVMINLIKSLVTSVEI